MTKLWVWVQWAVALSMAGGAIAARPAVAQEVPENDEFSVSSDALTSQSDTQSADTSRTSESPRPVAEMPSYREMEQPATTLDEWMAQIEASIIQIVGVRVEETATGLQIVLETAEGELATPITTVSGNAVIAEIPNAVLALPEGDSFEQFGPVEGIALMQLTNLPGNQVRVAITGTDAPPVVEVTATGLAVTLGEAVANTEGDAIQIVVTGEADEGYNPRSASTGTRTDTPLRDIPASITVVPQQVLEDRNVRTVIEGVETVSSVAPGDRRYGSVPIPSPRIIRGFDQGSSGVINFRNGFPDSDFYSLAPIETVERIEVLRGPASVLFGAGEPGGIVNVITRQPLDEPYYNLAFEVGNYGLYQPSIDLSGPLTENDTVLYRFITSYQGSSDFQGFADNRVTTIAPSIALNLGERTDLNLYYEYTHLLSDPPGGLSNAAILSDGSLTPRDFATYYPDLNSLDVESHKFGYTLEYEFNNSWQLRNNVSVNLTHFGEDETTGFALSDDERFLIGFFPSTAVF